MKYLRSAIRDFELGSTGKWFVLSAVIGVVAGLGGIGFHIIGECVKQFTLASVVHMEPGEAAGESSIFEPI